MKVDITKALNEYFKYDNFGFSGFKHNKYKTVGLMKTDDLLEVQGELSFLISSHDIEVTGNVLRHYPAFEEVVKLFYLPLPIRILADDVRCAAFIYPEYTFVVAPVKEV